MFLGVQAIRDRVAENVKVALESNLSDETKVALKDWLDNKDEGTGTCLLYTSKCKELLGKFGGHPMAAGMSIPIENINTFRKKLNEVTTLTNEDLIPKAVSYTHLMLYLSG